MSALRSVCPNGAFAQAVLEHTTARRRPGAAPASPSRTGPPRTGETRSTKNWSKGLGRRVRARGHRLGVLIAA